MSSTVVDHCTLHIDTREGGPELFNCVFRIYDGVVNGNFSLDQQQKLSWLQRHDRESGDLYGIVPLIKGMPVAVTDQKLILRGRVGTIHSWILSESETSVYEKGRRILRKMPKVVFTLRVYFL